MCNAALSPYNPPPPPKKNRSDKYALFNIWRRPPALNARLVTLSRSVLQFTIFVHVVMSRVFFANWCVRAFFVCLSADPCFSTHATG